MSSSCFTSTETVPTSFTLYLPQEEVAKKARSAIEELCTLLETFHDWQDPLSRKLFRWGVQVLNIGTRNGYAAEEEILEIAVERIDLLREILNDPLSHRPIEDPVLVGRLTMDRKNHIVCQMLFSESHPESLPSEEPREHLFAKQMNAWDVTHLSWLPKSCDMPELLTPEQTRFLSTSPELKEMLGMQKVVYLELVERAVVLQRNEDLREELEEAFQEIEDLKNKLKEVIMEAEDEMEATAEAITAKIRAMNEDHRNATARLQAEIDSMDASHNDDIEALQARMKVMDASHETQMQGLQAQYASIIDMHKKDEDALRGNIQQLKEKQEELRKQQQEREESLKAKMELASQASKDEREKLAAVHKEKTQELSGKLAATTQEVRQVKRELSEQEQKNQRNATEIANLRAALTQSNHHISSLQNAVANADSGGICSLM